MNKLFVSILLVLALSACGSPEPQSHETSMTNTPKALQPGAQEQEAARQARIEAAKKSMSPTDNPDPQTDRDIDLILGNHVAYHKAISDFQKAVAANDTDGVAAMVRYPLTIDVGGQKITIESAGRFKQYYGSLIPPETAKVIADSHYSDVMISHNGILLGDGKTWMTGDCSDADCKKVNVKIASFQQRPSN